MPRTRSEVLDDRPLTILVHDNHYPPSITGQSEPTPNYERQRRSGNGEQGSLAV